MISPSFLCPDGKYREEFSFSTSIESRFFQGKIDPNTAYLQISVLGRDFEDNPDLITFEGETFSIPSPSKYPDGYLLMIGENIIKVRSILTDGSVTEEALIRVTLLQSEELPAVSGIPVGVRVERLTGLVRLSAEIAASNSYERQFLGMNYYAATSEGGGSIGYKLLNPSPIGDVDKVIEYTTIFGQLAVDSTPSVDANGDLTVDPLYFRVFGYQEDTKGDTVSVEFNERMAVNEATTQFRTSITVESIAKKNRYSFTHNRLGSINSTPSTVPDNEFSSTPLDRPLYYVVTAVYYNTISGVEFESPYSLEVVGYPIQLSLNTASLPTVSRRQVVREIVTSIHRANENIAVQPGAVLRDTFIDPMSAESVRLRFLIDFLSRTQSFSTLLEIDDPTNSGFSISPASSPYKQALAQSFYLKNSMKAQNLIDAAFEKLASNVGVYRRGGTPSRGQVTFYVTSKPTTTHSIPLGTTISAGSLSFRTTAYTEISLRNLISHYDPSTGWYEVTTFAICNSSGLVGNVSVGKITTVTGLNVLVRNKETFFGGRDQESNRELAVRAQHTLSSVDTGTLQGYRQLVSGLAGVAESKIVGSGESLMKRDYDNTLQQHKGGKVDVYIRGSQDSIVTDNFAFSFETKRDVQFEVVGDPQDLIFEIQDQNLTLDNPLIEVLDLPDEVPPYGIRNHSEGTNFVLTGLTILSYNRIQLSSQYNDPADLDLTDVVMGDYRYRTSNAFTMSRQPVLSLIDVSGSNVVLTDTEYALYRKQSILEMGYSTLAADHIQISTEKDLGSVTTVTDEEHILVGNTVDYLRYLGINPLTIVITDSEGTEYASPTSSFPDYRVIEGDDNTPLGIQRTENSAIPSGSVVIASYKHDENYTVTYSVNSMLSVAQNSINNMKHLTADVVVKEAVRNIVDISATVILSQGAEMSVVDRLLRGRLYNLFNSLSFGTPLRQSDIIEVIDNTTGVSYVVVPLTKVSRTEESYVVREAIDASEDADIVKIDAWSTNEVCTYLIKDPLNSDTLTGGGSVNEFRAVYQGTTPLEIIVDIPNSEGLPFVEKSGRAFIIGYEGMSIQGYSDQETLQALYPSKTENEINDLAVSMTANRVLVTMSYEEIPTSYTYDVTYFVGRSEGVSSIETGPIEYLIPGTFEFLYDSDSVSNRLSAGTSYSSSGGY